MFKKGKAKKKKKKPCGFTVVPLSRHPWRSRLALCISFAGDRRCLKPWFPQTPFQVVAYAWRGTELALSLEEFVGEHHLWLVWFFHFAV